MSSHPSEPIQNSLVARVQAAVQKTGSVLIQGCPVSAAPFVFQAFRQAFRDAGLPRILLAPSTTTARELQNQFDTLGFRTWLFPEWEPSVFSTVSPSIKIRLERVGFLSSTMKSLEGPSDLWILPVTTLASPTLSRARFSKLSFSIETSHVFESREELHTRLLSAGYLRTETVEDPGSYAVRGDILDIFLPHEPHPYRIEFFDTMVEKIRRFNAETQRTLKDATALTVDVIPVREALLDPESRASLKERVKDACDTRGVSRIKRDPYLESLLAGTAIEGLEAWSPWLEPTPGSILDYFGPSPQIAVWDPDACEVEWRRWAESQREWLESPDRLLPLSDSVSIPESPLQWLKESKLSFLGPLSSEKSMHSAIRLRMETLETLRQLHADSDPDSLNRWALKLDELQEQADAVQIVYSADSQKSRMRWLLDEHLPKLLKKVTFVSGHLDEGFLWNDSRLLVLSEREFFPKRARPKGRAQTQETKTWAGMQQFADLVSGDLVVHRDHGIGRYQGLTRMTRDGAESDYLTLEYSDKNKLYLPVVRLNLLQKYMGGSESAYLDRLGSAQFQKTKDKVKEALRRMAFDLVELYAQRKLQQGIDFSTSAHADEEQFQAFVDAFPYEETPDQLKAIEGTLQDMRSGRVMDRLICGDVGFGKTEVALRAAFLALQNGTQVALLVPTTVLAFQHEQTFRARLKDSPVVIESVSRFKTAKEQKATLARLAAGQVDLIVGTHRLLSRDVKFKNLGLVIVDEEHRFGVEHKERLKTLRLNTHVLTLTATPIPRTLHLSLSGLRDISLMTTPPVDRLPIRTTVSPFDDELIKKALDFELSRGGQVFFVHNRVQGLPALAEKLSQWAPQAKVSIAHGQMSEAELERAMVSFYQKETHILLCTSIIESGLDIPNANTIIISQADHLGLAQLYQLRGRVGRSQQRAFCYCLVDRPDQMNHDARRRLEVIQRFVELGSGFQIASHDLEIRGGGNLLGAEQSGHIAAVGFELYTELLEEAIQEIQHAPIDPAHAMALARDPEIQCPYPSFFSETYIPDVQQRLSLYRRISLAETEDALLVLEEECTDRFGPLPHEASNLFWVLRIKLLLKRFEVPVLSVGPERLALTLDSHSHIDPAKAVRWARLSKAEIVRSPTGDRWVTKSVRRESRECEDIYFQLEGLLREVGQGDRTVVAKAP